MDKVRRTMMKKTFPALLASALALVLAVFLVGCTQSVTGGTADPQKLLIPRWFLSELTVNGQKVDIPAGQQKITLQFEDNGKANGTGGCNTFGSDYKASKDGKLSFGQMMSTLMACDDMQQEGAYFDALAKVQQFQVDGGILTLSSTDGKNLLVFSMPPK
jgi:heat shock protein HslJ